VDTRPTRHLAYVLKRFPRISETFIAAELIELERQGEHVTVFAISCPDEPFRHAFLRELRAEVRYLPHRLWREPRRVAVALGRTLRAAPSAWWRVARGNVWPPGVKRWRHVLQATVLRDEMIAARIDHAHAHFATSAAQLAAMAHAMGGPPFSVTCHAKDIWHADVDPTSLRARLLPAAFVATVSEANRDYLASMLQRDDHVHVVANSVDVGRLRAGETRPSSREGILTVARLVEKKGICDLLDAVAILDGRGLRVHVDVVGDGPLRPSLEAQAEALGIDARFHGALRHEDVVRRYERSAVFCLPCVIAATGDRDALPTSVLEAMAMCVPVVTTGVNGLADVVLPGQTGLRVREHDPMALADALERVLVDRAMAERLAEAAAAHVTTSFSLDRSVQQLRGLFPAVH